MGNQVQSHGGQRHTQPGQHHLGPRGEVRDVGEELQSQALVLVCGEVGPVTGDLGVEGAGAKELNLWELLGQSQKVENKSRLSGLGS